VVAEEGLPEDLLAGRQEEETTVHREAHPVGETSAGDLSRTFLHQEAMVSMVGVRPLHLRTIMIMDPCVGDLQARDLHLTVVPSPGGDPLLLEVVSLSLSALQEAPEKSTTPTWRRSTMVVAQLFLLEEDQAVVGQEQIS